MPFAITAFGSTVGCNCAIARLAREDALGREQPFFFWLPDGRKVPHLPSSLTAQRMAETFSLRMVGWEWRD